MAEAGRLSQRYAGKTCRYQPFDPDKETKLIQVSDNRGFQTMLISAEIMAGVVNGDYVAGDEYALSADLSAGWLVDMDTDIANLPRSTEYGGLIEHAVFMIVNSGIGKLNGSTSLQLDVHAPVDASFPRGSMTIGLANSQDQLVVGIDALDQLVAQYIRDGRIVYERTGLGHQSTQRLHLGVAVGSIAAVLVRVADLDAAASKKTKKKPSVALCGSLGPSEAPLHGFKSGIHTMPSYPSFEALERIYAARARAVEQLKINGVVTPAAIFELDRGGRFLVASELWTQCSEQAKRDLLHDPHPHIRSTAIIAQREADKVLSPQPH